MKGRGLKIWQAILLVFSSVCAVSGGVVLYTYLTNGFGDKQIKPDSINFVLDDNKFNSTNNQFEVEGDFSLTINSPTEDVTEKEISLSFAKTLSSQTVVNTTEIIGGVQYISNGVIAVPSTVTLGEPFTVLVEQKQYNDFGNYVSNVGGITTLKARSKNLLDAVGSTVNIAVDVPIEKIDLEIKDTSTGKKYEINDNIAKVFQNINFEIDAKYFPTTSGYRYSDNLFKQFYNIIDASTDSGDADNSFVVRRKDFCYDVVSGQNVVMEFNEGDVYFTSSMVFSNNNKVDVYAFKNASKQDEFEATNPQGEAEVVYNSKLKFLKDSNSGVQNAAVTIEIVQADVADYSIAYNSFDTMKTNKLFTLTANNQNQGDATLGLTISDSEGVSVSSMISQIGLKISYKTPGMENYEMLTKEPAPLVVKSLDKVVIGDQQKDNPYRFPGDGGDYYFIINSSVKNLNNAYWEFSTSEETMSIKIEVVLFKTEANEQGDYETRIFKNELPTAMISVSAGEDSDVMWLGNTTENLSIVFRGENKIPSQLSLAEKTDIPAQNTYKTVYYLVRKEDEDITANDVNVDTSKTRSLFNPESSIEDGYCVAESSELLFKAAGEYSIVFVTIKTDAYGRPIWTRVQKTDEYGAPRVDGNDNPVMEDRYQIIKKSSVLTVNVKETLQSFQEASFSFDDAIVGAYQPITSDSEIKTDADGNVLGNYYTKAGDDYNPITDNAARQALLNNFANAYYPSYYALQTGTSVTLNITVAESDTTKLNTEYGLNLVSFYAISARTNEDGTPAYKYKLEVEGTPNYSDQKATFTLKLPNDRITECYEKEGEGLGFYIAIGYDNSIEEVMTKVNVFDGRERVIDGKNCFMLYTPIACTIENPTLNDQNYKAEISMGADATYSNCTIVNKASDKTDDKYEAEDTKSGKDKFNEEIAKTVVKDFYGKEMEDAFSIQVEQGAQTIYVVDDGGEKLEFNSGKEYDVSVTLYANENCKLSFKMDVESNGLYKARIDGNDFLTFANVNATKSGAASEVINLYNSVNIFVGTSAQSTELNSTHYFFYLDDTTDTDLLNMFDFYGSIEEGASPIATGDLNTTTPISKFETKQDFAQGKALVFKVSNKDYSNSADTTVETINLKVTYNFTSNINAVINIQDADLVGENKVFAGKEYGLDNLVTLNKISSGSLSWNTPFNILHYIRQDGTVVAQDEEQQSEDLGKIVGGKITFYDVAETKTVTVKLFYFDRNPYAFNCEAEFTLCPNLKIQKVDSSSDLDIVELANKGSTGLNISNYLNIARISSGSTDINPDVTKLVILANGYPVVINDTGTNFVFDTSAVFKFQYNEYSKDMPIGIKLGGLDVKDIDGNKVVYNDTKAIVKKDIFLGGTGDNIITANSEEILYNGIDVLKVITSNEGYTLAVNQKGSDDASCKFEFLPAGRYYTLLPDNKVKFTNQTTQEGILFGETYYLLIAVQANKGNNNVKVAEVKIPLMISTVGNSFVQYEMAGDKIDFNSLINGNNAFYALADEIETEGNRSFLPAEKTLYNQDGKAQITLSEKTYLESVSEEIFEIGENNYRLVRTYREMPYAQYTAGTCTRFTFKDAEDATDDAVVYDELTAVEVKFANGLTETTSKYGTIIKDDDGEYWLQLNNLAGEPVYQSIVVTFSKDGKSFEFEYRIKITPNAETSTIYPFSEGENSAEYVSVSSNATYDFAQNFGSYAGAKSDNTRFNLDLDITNTQLIYDDSKEYYVQGDIAPDSISGKYVLTSDTVLYDVSGNRIITLANKLVLESYDSTTVEIGENSYHRVRVSSAEYRINKIVVGSNGELITGSVEFATLTNGTETKYITSTNYYRLSVSSIAGGKHFELYYNNDIILDATFTEAGLLTMNSVDSSHFVNFYVQKSYTNIVEGTLEYKFFMNDTNGRNYIEYSYKDEGNNLVTLPAPNLTEVEDLIQAGSGAKTYNLLTKYTTSSGTQIADLELNVSAGLKDRNGDAAELANAINVSNETALVGETGSGIVLSKVEGSGKYTLNVSVKADVNQNYTLEIFFMTSTKMISTLIIHITPSFTLPNTTPTFMAGSTIEATLINNAYNAYNINISSIAVDEDSSRVVNYVNGALKIADLMEDVQGVVLDVKINNNYYLPITFNIAKNITPKASYTNPGNYYAEETENISFDKFYDGVASNNFTASATIPLSFINYVDANETKVANSQFCFVSKNVETEIRGVRVVLNFEYNFEGIKGGSVAYQFNSNFVVNILPNVAYTITYPNPDGNNPLDSESVYFGTEYKNFFGGTAPFANQKRLVVAKAKTPSEEYTDLTNAKIRVKNVNGAVAYVKTVIDSTIFNNKKSEGYIYTKSGDSFVAIAGTDIFDETATYYIRISQTNTAWEFNGLNQDITFEKYGNYADGSMTFEIEFNKVVCEYKVRCYEDIVNFDIVNSTNCIDGKEELFIEQLEEGNVLAENAVAKLNMGTAASGVYFIKVARNDNVNPYSWVGFNYDDSTDGNIIYVFLGASCRFDMEVVEGKKAVQPKDILGIFGSKESNAINYLKNKTIDMELTSFVNMTYKTMKNNKLTLVPITNAESKTTILDAIRNNAEIGSFDEVIYKVGEDYYKRDGLKLAGAASGTKKYAGTYDVYDGYVKGTNIFLSAREEPVSGNISLGRQLKKETNKFVYANGTEKELYSFGEGADKAYVVKEETNVQSRIKLKEGATITLYEIDKNATTLVLDNNTLTEMRCVGGNTGYAVFKNKVGDNYYVVSLDSNGQIKVTGGNVYEVASIDEVRTIGDCENVTIAETTCLKVTIAGTTYYVYDTDTSAVVRTPHTEGEGDDAVTTYTYTIDLTGKTVLAESEGEPFDVGITLANANLTNKTYSKGGKTYFVPGGIAILMDGTVTAENVLTYKPTTDMYPTYFTTAVKEDTDYLADYKYLIFGNSHSTQVTGNGKSYLCSDWNVNNVDIVYYLPENNNAKVYRPFSNKVTMSPKGESELTLLTGAAQDYVKFKEVSGDSEKWYIVKKEDLRTTALTVGSTTYYSYDINTFSITQIQDLEENDEVEVKILYVVDGQMKDKTFNFKLKIDVEMRNAIFSDNETSQAEQLVDKNGKIVNYIEVETNKEYNFNNIVGLYKKSTQNQMTNLDFNNKHTIDVSVVSLNDPLFASGDFKDLKDTLGDELKDNSANIRMSWELVKTSSSEYGVIYNFTLTPLGADNNGDFVLMKYSYKSQVKDFANFGNALDYEKTEYVLFKIVSDYVVSIKDVEGNSVSVTSLENEKNNANSVVEITNNTFNPMVSDMQIATYFDYEIGLNEVSYFSDQGGSGAIKYKFGYGRKDEFSSGGDAYTAVTLQKGTETETFYVLTGDINKGEIKNSAYLYNNIKIPVTSGQNQMVRITSKNSINPAKDLSALLFDATLSGETTYITNLDGDEVKAGNGGLKMSSKDLYLGQQDLMVTLCDKYGYTVKFYFTLMASANPTYAAGSLEYVEGDKFDLGARYQELQATNYVVESSSRYEIKEDTVFINNSTIGNSTLKYRFVQYESGSVDEYNYIACENISGVSAYRLILDTDIVSNTERFKKDLDDSGTFYSLSNVNVTHSTVSGAAALNMPYPFGTYQKAGTTYDDNESTATKDEFTTLYLTAKKEAEGDDLGEPAKYIDISTTYLQTVNNSVFYLDTTIKSPSDLHAEPTYTFAAGGLTNNSYVATADGNGYVYDGTVCEAGCGHASCDRFHYVKVNDGDDYVGGTNYYRILDKKTLTATKNAYVSFNMPYGFGKIEGATQGTVYDTSTDYTTIYLPGTNKYINVPNDHLKVSRLSVETKAPIETLKYNGGEQTGTPDQAFKDIIELDGISAYGFKDNYIQKAESLPNQYLNSECDIDKLRVESIKLFAGDSKIGVIAVGNNRQLATTTNLFKYSASSTNDQKMGRDVIAITESEGSTLLTIPELPGWVYEEKDYAFVEMRIALKYKFGEGDNDFENYTLPLEIRVTKKIDKIISNQSAATNVSDSVSFSLSEHIKPDTGAKYVFIDDTLAVTLPGNGKVKVHVVATKENKSYSGETSLASNYSDADYTYYVSLSRIVGRTLEEGFEVNVTFSEYDENTVTHEGHVGYFASYGYGTTTINGSEYSIHQEASGESKISAKYNETNSLVVYVPEDGSVKMKIVATKGTEGKTGYDKCESAEISIDTTTTYVAGEICTKVGKELDTNYNLEFIFFDCGGGETGEHKGFYATYGNDETAEGKERSIIATLKPQTNDVLHLTDKGHLAGEKQYVTKYYIAKNTQTNDNDEECYYYQFVKNYNLYPAYIDFETTGNNNRIETSGAPGIDENFYIFDLSTWGDKLSMSYYNNNGGKTSDELNGGEVINKFYFEVGEDDTTSAEIDENGTLRVKRDVYAGKLNGEVYVTVNVFLKAGGETGAFPMRENDRYNTRVISIKIYLRDNTDIFTRLEELETLATQYKEIAPSVTYSARQLALMYVRASKYNDTEWNMLAGTLPENFVSYVEEHSARYAQEFRIMDDFVPSTTSGTLDFKHFMAVLNMYEDSTNASMKAIVGDQSISDLGGWAGDLATLVKDVRDDSGADSYLDKARRLLAGASHFGLADYISDLDASNIYNIYLKTNSTKKIGEAMREYYSTDMSLREKDFLIHEFEYADEELETLDVDALTAKIKTRFTSNLFITGVTIAGVTVVEGLLSPINNYTSQIDACCQAFAEKLLSGISAT